MTENQDRELLSIADDLYYAAEYVKAIEVYEKVLTLAPQNERAHEQIAKAKLLLLAEEEASRIPIDATRFLRMARSHVNAGSPESAMELLRRAIETAHEAGVSFPQAEELLSSLYDWLKEIKRPKVFISYARSDVSFATDVYWFLHNNGCNPWMDIYDLVPGQDWDLEIRHNIKSADFFIACLSNNSVSKRGYIQKELKEAIAMLEQTPEGKIYIIPIRIDDCVVPDSLANRHWLDWSTPNANETLLKAIKHKE